MGTRLSFGDGSPAADTQLAGRRRLPYQIPRADTLFAIEPGACAHDFIANAGLQAWRQLSRWGSVGIRRVNVRDLKLSRHDAGESAQCGLPLSNKAVTTTR